LREVASSFGIASVSLTVAEIRLVVAVVEGAYCAAHSSSSSAAQFATVPALWVVLSFCPPQQVEFGQDLRRDQAQVQEA